MNNNSILRLFLLMTIGILITFTACNDDEGNGPTGPTNKTTGFVISVVTPNNTSLVKYFETLPTGTADISDGFDFLAFNVQDAFNGALYLQNTDGTSGISKIVVDENGEIQVAGQLTTMGRVDPISIRDSETGVYYDYGDATAINVFNPDDMTFSGSIDMSGALYPREEVTRYREFYIRDNQVFAPLGSLTSPIWYNPLVTHIADIDAGTFVGNIEIELEGPVRHNQFFGGRYVDENGNLYITDQGDLLTGAPARLHRVNSGATDFDPTFELDVAGALNPMNLILKAFNSFTYIGNGMAISSVAVDTPAQAIAILASVGFNPAALSAEQQVQIQVILNEAENAAWSLIDLNAKTVVPIEGIPSQNVNHRFTITEIDGKWYLPVETSSETAYYSYDPATGAAEKAFDLVGGEVGNFVNLESNN
ncbi:MAG: hypothetical protein AAFQ94_21995 [Bacteroidota bacterium]